MFVAGISGAAGLYNMYRTDAYAGARNRYRRRRAKLIEALKEGAQRG